MPTGKERPCGAGSADARSVAEATRERLSHMFDSLGVAYIGGADCMSDDEVSREAARLHQWRDRRLIEGAPLYPANVCIKCLHPHLPVSHGGECTL